MWCVCCVCGCGVCAVCVFVVCVWCACCVCVCGVCVCVCVSVEYGIFNVKLGATFNNHWAAKGDSVYRAIIYERNVP